MGTISVMAAYGFALTEPKPIDPADVDVARRLTVALEVRGIALPDDVAVEVARELAGVDPYWP